MHNSAQTSQYGLRLGTADLSPGTQSIGLSEDHSMSPSLKQFSNLNEDLVFEDEDDQQVSASVQMPANRSDDLAVHRLAEHSHIYKPMRIHINNGDGSFIRMERTALEQSDHPLSGQMNAQYHQVSERIRRFDSHSNQYPSPLDIPHSTLNQLVSNHLTPESVSDLAPRGQHEPKVNRDILPKKRSDFNRIEMISANDLTDRLTDNNIANRVEPQKPLGFSNENSGEQHSMTGDHILRPFFRKERKQQKLVSMNKVLRDHSDWSLNQPKVELKRLTERSQPNHSGAIFKKRLPLMSNEEGFILTKLNSSLQNKETPIEKRADKVNSVSNSRHQFKRRFGDLVNEPNSNHVPSPESRHQQGHANNFVPNDPFRMRYLTDDISMNDLDLDDIGPSRMPIGPHNRQKNFKSGKLVGSKAPNGPFEQTPHKPNSAGQPISQIMPLFFDKFLSEFGNSNQRLSPEGFSLPPNQEKFDPFEQTPPGAHSNPHIPPATNQMDPDIADLDDPNQLERRLTNGNLHQGKPEIGPPLFSNDILPSNEFENEFGPWPKIFRFTEGRTNLHDFEREKKRSRIKFSPKVSKSQALYNIKRESFLILHGGTFSQ